MRTKILASLGLAAAMLTAGSITANAAPAHGMCGTAINCRSSGGHRMHFGMHNHRMNFRMHGHRSFNMHSNYRYRGGHWNWNHTHRVARRGNRWCRFHHCGSRFGVGVGFGFGWPYYGGYPYYGAYYPDYGTYGGYYSGYSYRPRGYGISCLRASRIVYNHGFRNVRTVSCGVVDRFAATWHGHRGVVAVRPNGGISVL